MRRTTAFVVVQLKNAELEWMIDKFVKRVHLGLKFTIENYDNNGEYLKGKLHFNPMTNGTAAWKAWADFVLANGVDVDIPVIDIVQMMFGTSPILLTLAPQLVEIDFTEQEWNELDPFVRNLLDLVPNEEMLRYLKA